jgi:predicted secreted protein
MSLSSAVSSFGTLLRIGDGATPTEAFTTIAEVLDISGPSYTLDTEEVTNHSTTGGYKEYIATLKDGGEVTFSVNFFQDTTHEALFDDFENRTRRNFQIVLPISSGDDTFTFAAFVTSIGLEAPVQGVLTRPVTLKVTGQGTWSGA